jgi:pimeloyl-ACP methyl ester carboxylesterase
VVERIALPSGEHLALHRGPEPGDTEGDHHAPRLLYLHGFGSSVAGTKGRWFRQRMAEVGWGVAGLDFRGHGASGGEFRDLTLSRNLEDVAAALEHLAATGGEAWARPVLFGSSMGGLSALHFAARHPERVAAVVTIAPALDLAASARRRAGDDGVDLWRRQGFLDFDHEHEGVVSQRRLSWGFLDDVESHDPRRLDALAPVPLLVLQGQRDDSVDWRPVAELVERLAAAELHLFSDGDHRLVDRLDRLWALTRGFVEGLRRRPADAIG